MSCFVEGARQNCSNLACTAWYYNFHASRLGECLPFNINRFTCDALTKCVAHSQAINQSGLSAFKSATQGEHPEQSRGRRSRRACIPQIYWIRSEEHTSELQ